MVIDRDESFLALRHLIDQNDRDVVYLHFAATMILVTALSLMIF